MVKGYDLWPRHVPMLAHCQRCGHARLDHPGGGACEPVGGECECGRFIEPPLPVRDEGDESDQSEPPRRQG